MNLSKKTIGLIALGTVLLGGSLASSNPAPTPKQTQNACVQTVEKPVVQPSAPVNPPVENIVEEPAEQPSATGDSFSFSQSRRGTCSHHGGVARWL